MAKKVKARSKNPIRRFFNNVRGVSKRAGEGAADALLSGAAFKKRTKPKRVKAK